MVRTRTHSIIAFAAAAFAALVMAAPAPAHAPRVPDTFFGVSAPELWSITHSNRHAERDAQLDGMKEAGIDWARIEIGWTETEPEAPVGGKHHYDWTIADRLMAAVASRRMELMALPISPPEWARANPSCGRASGVDPARAGDYADFAAAIVARYGSDGSFWDVRPDLPYQPITRVELYNEPNWTAFWCDELDPETFGRMAKAAADAIHEVDPEAQAILGGLANVRFDQYDGGELRGMGIERFLARAIAAAPGLPGAVDAVGFHPYDLDPAVNLSAVGWFRARLNELGLGDAEIVLTEFGWRSGGLLAGILSEPLRARNYTETASQIARTDCDISGVAAHTWQSRELNELIPDHWYGITDPITNLLYPSGKAYAQQIAIFEGRASEPAPREILTVCNAEDLPDQDGDGVPDPQDDYPLDPERHTDAENPGSPANRTENPNPFFGVNVVQLPSDYLKLGAGFEAMAGAGIGTVRQRLVWAQIEPVEPGDPGYEADSRWDMIDRRVLKMAQAGIGLRPSFGVQPDWVADDEVDAEYAAFLARFADRYGPNGSFWAENGHLDPALAVRDFEIWEYGNRDQSVPDGSASPGEYARMYLKARAALREAEPQARAIVSLGANGQSGRAAQFLRAMADAEPELGSAIDGLMVAGEEAPWAWAMDYLQIDARSALIDVGAPDAPLYFGFGAPTQGANALSEEDRAQFFTDVASRAARNDCGVAGIYAHAWTTPESEPGNPWHWYGIADPDDLSLSPAAEAYREVAAAYGDDAGDAVDLCGELHPAEPEEEPQKAPAPSAPEIQGVPGSPVAEDSLTVALSADGATGFECRIDNGAWEACEEHATFTGLGHGTHVLEVRGVNADGVPGPVATASWQVDLEGPEITKLNGPAEGSAPGPVELRFESDDPDATFFCKLDGGEWTECASPLAIELGPGEHVFRVRAEDELGNPGAVKTIEFTLAEPAPGAPRVVSGPGEGAVVSDPRPVFTVSGDASSFECRIDDQEWMECADGFRPAADLADGPHVLTVAGVTRDGARGAKTNRWFLVDTTAPSIRVKVKRRHRGARNARLKVRAKDPSGVKRIEYKVNRGAWKRVKGGVRLRRLSHGKHRIRVRAIDSAGNRGRAAKSMRVVRR